MSDDAEGFVEVRREKEGVWFSVRSTTCCVGTLLSRGMLQAIAGALESGCDFAFRPFPDSSLQVRVDGNSEEARVPMMFVTGQSPGPEFEDIGINFTIGREQARAEISSFLQSEQ